MVGNKLSSLKNKHTTEPAVSNATGEKVNTMLPERTEKKKKKSAAGSRTASNVTSKKK